MSALSDRDVGWLRYLHRKDRFDEPTVIDVDFPAIALREARWNPETATLTITLIAISNDPHTRTTFRVTNLADPTSWTAHGPLAPDTHRGAVCGARPGTRSRTSRSAWP